MDSFSCDNLSIRSSNTIPLIVPYLLPRNHYFEIRYLHYRISVDNATLDEVTKMITDFNPNLTKFYPTLAIVITSITDYRVVKKYINYLEIFFTQL